MREKKVLTERQYGRMIAYHIDPLMADSVIVVQHNPRCEREMDGTSLWKQRVKKGEKTFWKPFLLVLCLALGGSLIAGTDHVAYSQKADTPSEITQVQYVLKSFGYSVVVDGRFGPQTEKAVRHFQRVNGLIVDGIVGPQTLGALGLRLNGPVQASTEPAKRVNPPGRYIHPSPSVEQWHDLALSVGWQESHWKVLSCIINRESRGQANAKNPNSSATGLTQILGRYHPDKNLYDPTVNLSTALWLYGQRGWQPWTLPGHQCY